MGVGGNGLFTLSHNYKEKRARHWANTMEVMVNQKVLRGVLFATASKTSKAPSSQFLSRPNLRHGNLQGLRLAQIDNIFGTQTYSNLNTNSKDVI